MKHVLMVLLVLCAAAVDAQDHLYTWPDVGPVQKVFRFTDSAVAKVDMAVAASDGKPLYILECRAGGGDATDEEFAYSGMFHCRLKDLVLGEMDLLHDDLYEGKEWNSRGRFVEQEVWGDCGTYPEWGAVRTFRVRRMRITLSMTNIRFAPSKYPKTGVREAYGGPTPEVLSYDFEVSIVPDSTAISAQAEPAPFAEPVFRRANQPDKLFRSCSTPKRMHVDGYPAPKQRATNQHVFAKVRPATRSFDVQPGTTSFLFSPKRQAKHEIGDESFSLPILDEQGKRAYTLQCGSMGGYWQLNWITRCVLKEVGSSEDLLRDAVDLYSRRAMGIILVRQLQGGCQQYPDFGLSRTFRLRAMQVSLSFSDVRFEPKSEYPGYLDDPGLRRATLTITVKPDPTATDLVAMPSSYVWAEFDRGFMKHCQPHYRSGTSGFSSSQ